MYTHVRAMEYYSEKMKYDYCDNIVDLETITLSEISQIEEVKNHMISLIGGYKTGSNKRTDRKNKKSQTQTQYVVTGGNEEGGLVKGKEGQIHCGRRRFNFGRKTHKVIYR